MPREKLQELISVAHGHNVYVSTGGWIEYVLCHGISAVEAYLAETRALEFDVIEISTGFISLAQDDLLRLIEKVRNLGLKPKPELGIQFGAGGATAASELAAEGVRDAQWVISRAQACLQAGAEIIMIEPEGITGERGDVAHRRGGADHRKRWNGEDDVRSGRPPCVREQLGSNCRFQACALVSVYGAVQPGCNAEVPNGSGVCVSGNLQSPAGAREISTSFGLWSRQRHARRWP